VLVTCSTAYCTCACRVFGLDGLRRVIASSVPQRVFLTPHHHDNNERLRLPTTCFANISLPLAATRCISVTQIIGCARGIGPIRQVLCDFQLAANGRSFWIVMGSSLRITKNGADVFDRNKCYVLDLDKCYELIAAV
jgi:hypothetical protein